MDRRKPVQALLCVVLIATCGSAQKSNTPPKQAAAKTQQPQEFGKSYATLRPAQRRLIDDYIRRYNQTTGSKVVAQTAYDDARMSVRTTFDAVTHALLTTKMTDEHGKSLGHVIDSVEAIDDVMGEEQNVGGDRQFRIYVYLKPNTFDLLARAREFKRERDNSVYHKGFPTCFRLINGPPSIQISMSRDRRMADIDVDYRSSKFPQALVNGHLTASNSDVRAGDNLDRHDGRWQGLNGWWREVFGFALGRGGKPKKEDEVRSATSFPLNPPLKADRGVDEAMHDFLKTWIVSQDPTNSIAYFSRRSYACLEEMGKKNRKPIAPGMVRVRLKLAMQKFNETAGKLSEVSDAVEPPQNWSPDLKDGKNAYPTEFRLVEVPSDLGQANECVPELDSDKKSKEKYYATAFRTKSGDGPKKVISLLWAKEGDYWKIVSIRALDASEANITPKSEIPKEVSAEAAPQKASADPNAIRDITQFYRTWLADRDAKKAMSYVSERSFACLSAPQPGQGASSKPADRVRVGLQKANDNLVPGKKLTDLSTAVEPVNELIRSVDHDNSDAFAIMVVPDQMADGFQCEHRRPTAKSVDLKPADATYGKYYATASRLNLRDEGQSPALILLWSQDKDRWKVSAWAIEVP
jgi:hypothetical protein